MIRVLRRQFVSMTYIALVATVLIGPAGAADVPARLPDPDGQPGNATEPVQVYILAGQSNMVGMGEIRGAKNMYAGVYFSSDPVVSKGPLSIYRVGTYKIARCLNALALLASGNPEYVPLMKREAHWAAEFSADNFQTWYYGYVMMLLAEYKTATGDESVMPGLRRLALAAANGQSIVGSWGHKSAGSDGRLQGYGMMNAPGLPLTIAMMFNAGPYIRAENGRLPVSCFPESKA